MPIYEYACRCGHAFEEVILRSGDEAEIRCPACRSKEVARKLSCPADARTSAGRAPAGGRCGPVG